MARVMVIDDEEDIRLSLRRALELEGHEVTLAGDGEEGERLFKENPADLVIIDIMMPKKEGVEVLADLIADFPDLKCIMISGGARMAEGDDLKFLLDVAASHGASKVLQKPFDIHELTAMVSELLNDQDA